MKKSLTGVVLGRFAPLHKGHEALIMAMIARHGDASLVLVGSTNQNTDGRTPYHFSTRRGMILSQFPNVSVLPLPDVAATPDEFDRTSDRWLDQISALQDERNTHFVFYGGAKSDLKYLAKRFPTEVLIDRKTIPISGTAARTQIQNSAPLRPILSDKVIPPAQQNYGEM